MKSVGLLTAHRVNNCGSYLQTYATVVAVNKLGYDCTVIDYRYPSLWHLKNAAGDEYKEVRRKSVLKRMLAKLGVLPLLSDFRTWLYYCKGAKGLRKFAPVKMTKDYTRKEILSKPPKFDIYLTGSDQVWNPRYMGTDYTYLLDFTPEKSKRISYASSFGCKKLPDEFVSDYKRLLSSYDSVSVRETSGVDLVKELSGKVAQDVVDPTFLLDRETWCHLAGNKLGARTGFVFCYIMTYVFDPFPSLVTYLKFLADNLHKEVIVYCPDPISELAGDKRFSFIVGKKHMLEPQEFLEYYEKADYVVSTSFHGVAFSVNFRKNFLAILNPNQTRDDRVVSLLQKTNLMSRGIVSGSVLGKKYLTPADYKAADGCIRQLVKCSNNYLRAALDD